MPLEFCKLTTRDGDPQFIRRSCIESLEYHKIQENSYHAATLTLTSGRRLALKKDEYQSLLKDLGLT